MLVGPQKAGLKREGRMAGPAAQPELDNRCLRPAETYPALETVMARQMPPTLRATILRPAKEIGIRKFP